MGCPLWLWGWPMADLDPLDVLDLLADIEPVGDPDELLKRAEALRIDPWLIQSARRALDWSEGVPGAQPVARGSCALARLRDAVEARLAAESEAA